jgi:carboxyl-terminal processing protease
MLNFLKKGQSLIILVLFIGLSFTLGMSYGQNHSFTSLGQAASLNIINNDGPKNGETIDMAPFWKVWNLLDDKYVATKKVASTTASTTPQDRIWGAIQGMTDSMGDPYTVFMPPEDTKDFEENISGNFEGVGMEIGIKDGVLSVISPLKGSPAEAAGIKTGDKIITIDGEPAVDLSTDKAVKLIRGAKGTVVKITVLRNGNTKPLNFEITRAVINIPTTKTEIKDDVFVISLYNFYAQSKSQFNLALKEFVNSKKHKLILDLRGNPGGYLDSAVDMASWFLPLGKTIVREDFGQPAQGGGKPEIVYRSKGYDIFNQNLKMIILVDGGSASASEILAGALQEHGIAKLVGTKTYGKGSVQELVKVTDNTSLKVTIAKWLTPNGKSISEGGLTPDYEVKISEADIKAEKDTQMDKALELLK